ncbi:MAG: Hpt domain-containing protein [Candidatus Polarisedimenticolaceae bacterium]|nr:Hpt domain-containing protein [Candidatus Polarisedimenticolaceae bacterium]
MNDAREYSTLPWVKNELDELITQARHALEEYAEGSGEQESIQTCIERLHQIYGTLRMVQLFGAAMLAEEMELAARALEQNQVSHHTEAAETLMRALITLPDYLEKMQSGYRDIPILVLPLMNDLRAARDADLLSDVALFAPALESRLAFDQADDLVNEQLPQLARRLRYDYHKGLLGWYQGKDQEKALGHLEKVARKLEKSAGSKTARQLFRIARGTIVALKEHAIEPGTAVKLLLGRLDRQIKLLMDHGEAALKNTAATDLQKNLLYYIGQAETENKLVQSIKDAFELELILPSAEEVEAGREELSGLNRELLESLHHAIQADLLHIKDQLDLFIRSSAKDTEELKELEQPLRKIADTLGMVGRGELRERMKGQANRINEIVAGDIIPDETVLMEIAGDILFVETSLSNLVPAYAAPAAIEKARQIGITPEKEGEFSLLVQAVFSEAGLDMAHIRESIAAFIESPDNKNQIAEVPQRFFTVAGALKMLGLTDASELLEFTANYINDQFICQGNVPDTAQTNALADAITSLEYYMEAVVEGRSGQDAILEIAHHSLETLGWNQDKKPMPADARHSEAITDIADTGSKSAQPDLPEKPAEERVESLPSAAKPALDDLDSEIIDIFVEEAREELAVIQEYLPRWRQCQDDTNALITFRRSFHTLKGSGRLVGAMDIGELAWAIENLLNRVIDRTILPSSHIFAILDEAVALLPELIGRQEAGEQTGFDVQPLVDKAMALSEQKPVESQPEPLLPESLSLESEEAPSGSAPAISMEPELLKIFAKETQEHLAVVQEFLDQCEMNIHPHPDERLLRAFHTLHGSAHMAEVDAIAQVSKALEALVNELILVNQPANKQALELMSAGAQCLKKLLASINATDAEIPDWQPLATRAHQYVLDLEGPTSQLLSSEELLIDIEGLELGGESGLLLDSDGLSAEETLLQLDESSLILEEEDAEADLLSSEGLLLDEDSVLSELEQSLSEPRSESILTEALDTESLLLDEGSALVIDEVQSMDLQSEPLAVNEAAADSLLLEDDAALEAREEPAENLTHDDVAAVDEATDEPEEVDKELVEIFLEEARELIDVLETSLQEWTQDPGNSRLLAELLRTLHTLKGGARLSGLAPIGDLSHAFESLLEAIEGGQVVTSPELLALALQVADRLLEQVDEADQSRPVTAADELIVTLEICLAGDDSMLADLSASGLISESGLVSGSELLAESELLSEPVDQPEEAESEKGHEDEPETPDEKMEVPQVDAKREPGATTESQPQKSRIRVRSELLDRLVNHAGEVSIYRARLEQQNGDLNFNLSELDQTVNRLRNQLRNLEIETEAQILFRYDREKEADEDNMEKAFDPLELDRFSNMQQLSRSLIETVNDLSSIKELMEELAKDNETLLMQQFRVATDLQDGLLRTRMVPFSQVIPRLHRIVRQTCNQLGKSASLEVQGTEGEMDRGILDRILSPLEHLLRNAVSHGIESPEERVLAGKERAGVVLLSLVREGTDVLLTVADDGAGLKLESIRQRAVERGLLNSHAEISDSDLMQLILEPGFSTVDEVTQISGRGVGMDVVVSEIKQINGSLEIASEPGQGTRFTIRLPLTLAISDALLVQMGDDIYAVPHASIEGVVRIAVPDLQSYYDGEQESFSYAERDYVVRYLGSMLGTLSPNLAEQKKKWLPMLLVRSGEHRVALQVDDLIGNRQIVVKSVGPQLSSVRWITGGTILGDGRVALILDVNALVRTVVVQPVVRVEEPQQEKRDSSVPTIMVVDDSITVRKVTTRLLERHDMNVMTAKDGVDAIEKLQDQIPDLMLLDIEMPRMDGFEVARHMRNSPHLDHIPIIMITSRTGDKHRNLAFRLGVKGYLGKPYQEIDLLRDINALLGVKG